MPNSARPIPKRNPTRTGLISAEGERPFEYLVSSPPARPTSSTPLTYERTRRYLIPPQETWDIYRTCIRVYTNSSFRHARKQHYIRNLIQNIAHVRILVLHGNITLALAIFRHCRSCHTRVHHRRRSSRQRHGYLRGIRLGHDTTIRRCVHLSCLKRCADSTESTERTCQMLG